MINLIAETNSIQESLIAFYVIMVIIGFVLMFVDKRRWKAHTDRSAEMMNYKRRRLEDAEPQAEDQSEPTDQEKGKKTKKDKKSKQPKDYEYEGRIKLGAFLVVGILFGAVGELLGMVFCRHKWYKPSYRLGVPALALLNIVLGALLLYLVGETGSDDAIIVTVARIVGNGLCI